MLLFDEYFLEQVVLMKCSFLWACFYLKVQTQSPVILWLQVLLQLSFTPSQVCWLLARLSSSWLSLLYNVPQSLRLFHVFLRGWCKGMEAFSSEICPVAWAELSIQHDVTLETWTTHLKYVVNNIKKRKYNRK